MEHCVVTGMHAMCALGLSTDEVWGKLINGQSSISNIEGFSTEGCYTSIGAEIKAFTSTYPLKRKKRLDKVSIFGIHSALEAFKDANLNKNYLDTKRVGVVVASCSGGAESFEQAQRQYHTQKRVSPNKILSGNVSCIANNIALHINARGLTTNLSNACAAGTMAIGYGYQLIENGSHDVVVVTGTDSLSMLSFGGFHSVKAMATTPCSPFSKSDGINLGEGAGTIILESLSHARKRKHPILAYITGYGSTSDGYHDTAPHPEGDGIRRAMEIALKSSQITSKDIGYINAHGTATPLNDTAERRAFESCFNNSNVSISSTKSMIGHCLGAAGVLEGIFAIKAMVTSKIPPTVNGCKDQKLDFVYKKHKVKNVAHVMSNSLAFGGSNASLIFSQRPKKLINIKRSVYINDFEIVSPIGIGKTDYWLNYKNGHTVTVNTEPITLDLKSYGLDPSLTRRWSRHGKLLTLSHHLLNKVKDPNNCGVLVGTADGVFEDSIKFNKRLISKGVHAGSPILFPNVVNNASAGCVALSQKTLGYTTTFVNGFLSGLNAVIHGYERVCYGKESCIIASGVDELSTPLLEAYNHLKVVGEKNTDGFTLSEGSVSLLLASEPNDAYAEIVGASLMTEPQPVGKIDLEGVAVKRAIESALKQAEISPDQVDVIIGFSNGSPLIDKMETHALKELFNGLKEPKLIHIKKQLGEGRGFSSALQIAHGCMVLKEQDDLKYALIISFSFGGSGGAMVIKK